MKKGATELVDDGKPARSATGVPQAEVTLPRLKDGSRIA